MYPLAPSPEFIARRQRLGMVPASKPIQRSLVRPEPIITPPRPPMVPPKRTRGRNYQADLIIAQVAYEAELSPGDLIGPYRDVPIVRARQKACFRMCTELKMSRHAIGRHLGKRDHSTITHSIQKHAQRIGVTL